MGTKSIFIDILATLNELILISFWSIIIDQEEKNFKNKN